MVDIKLYCPICNVDYDARVNIGDGIDDILEKYKCKTCKGNLTDCEEEDEEIMLSTEYIAETERENLEKIEDIETMQRTIEKLYEKNPNLYPEYTLYRELGSEF